MPDAIASTYNNIGATERYFPLGPIPPKAYLLNLHGLAYASAGGQLEIAHVLTLQDAADVAAHAAGRRLLARSTIVVNTQPGYMISAPANANPTWTLPLNLMILGGAAWIITALSFSAGLATWAVTLSVTWLSIREYQRIYGSAVPLTVIPIRPDVVPIEVLPIPEEPAPI